ncbi:MAG: endopeptidase La [Eubacterium sp.]|nr:endopeptidase La [Eubacterium sp.]
MEENRTVMNGIVLALEDTMILPHTTILFMLEELGSAYRNYLEGNGTEKVAVPLKPGKDGSGDDDLQNTGVRFRVKSAQEMDKGVLLQLETMDRVHIESVSRVGRIVYADFVEDPDKDDLDEAMHEQMLHYLKDIVQGISSHFRGGEEYMKLLNNVRDINSMIVWLSRYMRIGAEEKYEYLKTDSLRERSLRFMDDLLKQKEAVDWNIEINERITDKNNRYYRKQMLREQLKAIQEELAEDEPGSGHGKKGYKERIEESAMPENIREAALAEVEKLAVQQQGSAETSVIQNYLDFMLSLPWERPEAKDPDLSKAEDILNADHYGLDKVKKRIVEHLAVMKLRKDKKGSILLLVGPPGTGKTSLGKSIARALERKYVRLSLGGIRDESEIRGHRRTYVGAMPGRILNGIKQAGVTDPVMVLDEVDKLMTGGFSGDPASALLEVLDPEQNSTFEDHYLDLPYDLSDVFFIATANTTETIPAPLLDRMEVIEISSYTEDEKYHIAKEHLLAEVMSETGLLPQQLIVGDEVIHAIIEDYTREGGVRGLKKALLTIARAVSAEIVTGKAELPKTVTVSDLEDLLGRKMAFHDKATSDNPAGVVTGLAWTPVGGEILFVEAADMPGSGQMILTGQLGDVMQESARIALSLVKSRLPMYTADLKEKDLHIHVPQGAVPKDGPSAGITIVTALASLLSRRKVDSHLAMTGEITLRGVVMPIGGLKEKLLAAHRAGIRKVLIPRENLADLKELPETVLSDIVVIAVDTVEDVLREAIGPDLPVLQEACSLDAQPTA